MIAFDIDGCFVDLMKYLEVLLGREGIRIIENGKYDLETDPPITSDQLLEYLIDCYIAHDHIPIYPGAEELCYELFYVSRCPIHFITARPSAAATHTHLLVERFCNVPFTISFSGNSKLNYLNNYTFFVEDRRKTAREIAMAGKTVFMPDRPWNQMEYIPGIVRIGGIDELIPKLHTLIIGRKNGS